MYGPLEYCGAHCDVNVGTNEVSTSGRVHADQADLLARRILKSGSDSEPFADIDAEALLSL